jgi:acid stress-induced BolA-like protein IbaG/YrbA
VQQHRLVYGTINQAMETEQIHAFALKTYTPEKWAQADVGAISNG